MSEVLCKWASQQQQYSVGTLWTQQQNYGQLEIIGTQFVLFFFFGK
jgi:hypothetical protein